MTQFSQQPVPPNRKFVWASYSHSSEGRQMKQELQSHKLQNESHNHKKLAKMIIWITALCNSMKLWAMPWQDNQDVQVMVESSIKMWPTGEGNGKPLSILAQRTPWTTWKGKKMWHQKMSPQLVRCLKCYWGREEKWLQKERRAWAKAETVLNCKYVWWWK